MNVQYNDEIIFAIMGNKISGTSRGGESASVKARRNAKNM
jgi:hypothetical protein